MLYFVKLRKLLLLGCGLLLISLSSSCYSLNKVSADRSMISFSAGEKNNQFVAIKNEGSKKAYVMMSAKKLLNIGDPTPKYYSNKNPKLLGLLVSPMKLVLKPGQTRKVRVTDLTKPEARKNGDVFYKVFASQVAPPKKKGKESSGVGMKVEFNINTEFYVISRANPMKPNLSTNITDGRINMHNEGNTTMQMDFITQCDKTKTTCKSFGNAILYPGKKVSIKLLSDMNQPSVITFDEAYANKREKITLDVN